MVIPKEVSFEYAGESLLIELAKVIRTHFTVKLKARRMNLIPFCLLVCSLLPGHGEFIKTHDAVISRFAESDRKAKFSWSTDQADGLKVLHFGKRPVLKYMSNFDTSSKKRRHETYKVFHHVYSPVSGTIITKGPYGKYTHHRGLFIGWNKTSSQKGKYDFWHCTKGVTQRHIRILKEEADEKHGSMTTEIHWMNKEGKPVIVEERTIEVTLAKTTQGHPAWQIDWSTVLESREGTIKLDGDRQHAGFQFRAAQEVAEKNSARYLRPDKFPQQKKAYEVNDRTDPNKHVNLGWLAMRISVQEKQIAVEYHEDPSVPKPSRYSERPYGRFGAFFKTELKEGKPLEMHYRLFVSEGEPPSRKLIEKHHAEFLKDLKGD